MWCSLERLSAAKSDPGSILGPMPGGEGLFADKYRYLDRRGEKNIAKQCEKMKKTFVKNDSTGEQLTTFEIYSCIPVFSILTLFWQGWPMVVGIKVTSLPCRQLIHL